MLHRRDAAMPRLYKSTGGKPAPKSQIPNHKSQIITPVLFFCDAQ